MLESFKDTTDARMAFFASWTCALGPDAVADFAPALELAGKVASGDPGNVGSHHLLGAVFYRAGRLDESVNRLEAAETPRKYPGSDLVRVRALFPGDGPPPPGPQGASRRLAPEGRGPDRQGTPRPRAEDGPGPLGPQTHLATAAPKPRPCSTEDGHERVTTPRTGEEPLFHPQHRVDNFGASVTSTQRNPQALAASFRIAGPSESLFRRLASGGRQPPVFRREQGPDGPRSPLQAGIRGAVPPRNFRRTTRTGASFSC